MTVAQLDEADARQIASRIAARSNLLDVRGASVQADLIQAPAQGRRLTYALEPEVSYDFDADEPGRLVVQATFDLRLSMIPHKPEASDGDHEVSTDVTSSADEEVEDDSDLVATLRFDLQAYFSLEMRDDDAPADDEEIEAFAQTTGLFALWPFAREWAHDLTGRLGLPPLTLGVRFIPVDGPADR